MSIMELLIGLLLVFFIGISFLMLFYNELCKQVEITLNHIRSLKDV